MTRRICVVTTAHSSRSTRVFRKEACSLVARGYDVTLIAQHIGGEMAGGVRIIPLPPVRTRLQRILGAGWRAFRLALRVRADLYHFHDPEFLFWALILQRITARPVIYDVHEFYADAVQTKAWIPRFLRRPISFLVNLVEKSISRRLAGIVTVNLVMEGQFARVNRNTTTVHNYPLREFVDRLASPTKRDPFAICYVGSVTETRGLGVMIRAMRLVRRVEPAAHCRIIGPLRRVGGSDLAESGMLQDAGIQLIGEVPHAQVPDHLATCSIGWLPLLATGNYAKSTPVKLYEYMAARLPVVASDMGLIAETVQRHRCGLLAEPGSAEAHAEAILRLLAGPDEAWQMGERGRRAVLDRYLWETEVERMVTLYERVLSAGWNSVAGRRKRT